MFQRTTHYPTDRALLRRTAAAIAITVLTVGTFGAAALLDSPNAKGHAVAEPPWNSTGSK